MEENRITSPLASIIKKVAESNPSGEISRQREILANRLAGSSDEMVVLADVSGSMQDPIGASLVTKHEHLRIALDDVRRSHPKIRVIAFNGVAIKVTGALPPPAGGTALHRAIDLAAKVKPKRTIIISDGLPDNEMMAIESAKKITGIVDTIYCGPDNHPAIQFLRSLSGQCCGTHLAWDGYQTTLSSNVRGLLATGK